MKQEKEYYSILILSNIENEESIEDMYIATSFRQDGHIVKVSWIDYDCKLDESFDVIIRRNTWIHKKSQEQYYKQTNDALVKRLEQKNIKTVNLEGLDGKGKDYLCELFKNKKRVIPTIDNLNELDKLPISEEYVLKDNDSFGSGLGQRMVKAHELKAKFEEGDLIQPRLKFKSEIQCYFVEDKLMYVYEYTPSKWPKYPTPKLITLNKYDEALACEFAKESGLNVGFQRIDFLKLENDELILLEIEDNSPHMSIEELPIELRQKIIDEYKNSIYRFLKEE